MLTLVVAVGLVAMVAVLKAVMDRRAPQEVITTEVRPPEPVLPAATTPLVDPNSSNTAAILEQLRGTELRRDLDEVRELQAGGGSIPNTSDLLLNKLTHKEAEVRQAALVALVHLGDTNVLPGLEQVLASTQDPRDKVALMDAIEYLKLPEGSSEPPPAAAADAGGNTDSAIRPKETKVTPTSTVPAAARKAKRAARGSSQPTTGTPGAPTTQPASPAPGAAPPQ